MIFLARSKQRRNYIAAQIKSSMSSSASEQSAGAGAVEPEQLTSFWQKLAYQLPAWALLACFIALPVVVLLILLNR